MIAHAVAALVALGQSVLLCSYTHSALDNVLLKLLDKHVELLRIGPRAKVDPALHPHLLSTIAADLPPSADRVAALRRASPAAASSPPRRSRSTTPARRPPV